MSETTDLTPEQIEVMVDRRMDNTNDTPEQARAYVLARHKEYDQRRHPS
jgi:hypothetical protein